MPVSLVLLDDQKDVIGQQCRKHLRAAACTFLRKWPARQWFAAAVQGVHAARFRHAATPPSMANRLPTAGAQAINIIIR
jgi:hypothetical protein